MAPENSSIGSTKELEEALKGGATITLVTVIRCKDCRHCRLLNDGVSFECKEWDMDFYAPHYNAATYFCADGKRRTDDDQSD